jgi:hypothetical protein
MENIIRLSIDKDALLDKIDTYEKLVFYMRKKYRRLEEEFKDYKEKHCYWNKKRLPYYR